MTKDSEFGIIQLVFSGNTKYGGIAQLGERLNGIQEVSGSIPLISTRKVRERAEKRLKSIDFRRFFLHFYFS